MTAPSGRLWRLCRKELRETLRDRRTLITLVLMPLLLYPLLSMTLQRFLLGLGPAATDPVYRIAVASEAEGEYLQRLIEDPRSRPPREILEAREGPSARFELFVPHEHSPQEAVALGMVDLAASVDRDPQAPPRLELVADQSRPAGLAARSILVERLLWLRHELTREQLRELTPPGGDALAEATWPTVQLRTVGTESAISMLATLVPLVLVLMTITGAVYPAIDLTAGERERGTIESLMATPVPRGQVLVAKYVAVVTVALLTAVVNLSAMLITLKAGGLMHLLTGGEDAIPWFSLLQIFGLLILFSGFFSAVLLCLTSFARSFKEAQAYLIPLMLLSLAPGVLSLIPGVELTPTLALIPLVNIILLARELLAGAVDPVAAAAAVGSTVLYAAAALAVAAQLFGSNAVLRGSEMSAASLFRRPRESSEVPRPGTAALAMAIIFPAYFILANSLAQLEGISFQTKLFAFSAATAAVFGGIPLLAALLARDRPVSTFRLRNPLPAGRLVLALAGAALMGLGLWAFAHEAFVIVTGDLDQAKVDAARQLLASFAEVPLVVVLLAFAVTPGVFEELCFRGYLFSSLLKVMSPLKTIVITSLLFGLFHVLTGSSLLLERFVPTTLVGLFLGWVAYRTGSVWPGMLLHTVYNGFLNVLSYYRDRLAFLGMAEDEVAHLPPTWLAAAAALTAVGIALVHYCGSVSRADRVRQTGREAKG